MHFAQKRINIFRMRTIYWRILVVRPEHLKSLMILGKTEGCHFPGKGILMFTLKGQEGMTKYLNTMPVRSLPQEFISIVQNSMAFFYFPKMNWKLCWTLDVLFRRPINCIQKTEKGDFISSLRNFRGPEPRRRPCHQDHDENVRSITCFSNKILLYALLLIHCSLSSLEYLKIQKLFVVI